MSHPWMAIIQITDSGNRNGETDENQTLPDLRHTDVLRPQDESVPLSHHGLRTHRNVRCTVLEYLARTETETA